MTIALLVYITALLNPLSFLLFCIIVVCAISIIGVDIYGVDPMPIIKKLGVIAAIAAVSLVVVPTEKTAWLMVGGYAAQTAYQSEEGVKYRQLLLDKVESVLTQDKNKGENANNANK